MACDGVTPPARRHAFISFAAIQQNGTKDNDDPGVTHIDFLI
jgi:hypothetical protein